MLCVLYICTYIQRNDPNGYDNALLFQCECKYLFKLRRMGISGMVKLINYFMDDNSFYIVTELGFADLYS